MGKSYADASYPNKFVYFPIQFTKELYGAWGNLPFMAVDWSLRANFYDISDKENYHLNLIGISLDHSGDSAYVVLANWFAMGNFKDFLTLKFLSAAFITGLATKRQKEKFSKTSLLSYNFVLLSNFVILKFTSDTYTNYTKRNWSSITTNIFRHTIKRS